MGARATGLSPVVNGRGGFRRRCVHSVPRNCWSAGSSRRRQPPRSSAAPATRWSRPAGARLGEPPWRLGGDPAEHVESVWPAVERGPWLVQAGLERQQPDVLGRNVRRIGDEDLDPAVQVSGQRRMKCACVHHPTDGTDVAAGTPDRLRINVHGVQLDVQRRGQRHADRPGAAAQIDDDGPAGPTIWPASMRAWSTRNSVRRRGHEDSRCQGDTQTAELRQPRMCSMGSPATRRSTMTASSVGVPADSMSKRASSSAETHPCSPQPGSDAGSRTLGAGAAFMTPIQDLPVMRGPPKGRTRVRRITADSPPPDPPAEPRRRPRPAQRRVGLGAAEAGPALVERTFQPPQLVLLSSGASSPSWTRARSSCSWSTRDRTCSRICCSFTTSSWRTTCGP